MYGTSIEKAASSSISLWANLSHGRGWDVGGDDYVMGMRRGLKGEGWWVSQWEQQLHFLSPHCDALDPPNQQSATVLYHALNSISIILPHPTMVYHTFTHYHTITHPTSKDTRSSNCRWRQHQRGRVWFILEKEWNEKYRFIASMIYIIYMVTARKVGVSE